MALNSLLISGSNLNKTLSDDLTTAANTYNTSSSKPSINKLPSNNLVSVKNNALNIDANKMLNDLTGNVNMSSGLDAKSKSKIQSMVSSYIGRDMGGAGKLSLSKKMNLNDIVENPCNISGGFSSALTGPNLLGLLYSLIALLIGLLCAGIKNVFSALNSVINGTIKLTTDFVSGAISDTLSSIVGKDTISTLKDLSLSDIGNKIASYIPGMEGLTLNTFGKHTDSIAGQDMLDESTNMLDKLAPRWNKDESGNFTLAKISDNKPLIQMAKNNTLGKTVTPSLNTTDLTNRVLTNTEKMSLLSNKFL